MKVEQEKFGFEPIHITIYSKEEADLMWAALNASHDDIYKRSHNHIEKDMYPMWKAFDDVHPTGWC